MNELDNLTRAFRIGYKLGAKDNPPESKREMIPGDVVGDEVYVGIMVDEGKAYKLFAKKEDESGKYTWESAMDKFKDAMPSSRELNLMRANAMALGNFKDGYYWSSTEYASSNSWVQRFSDGNQNYGYKYFNFLVRCVRRLTL